MYVEQRTHLMCAPLLIIFPCSFPRPLCNYNCWPGGIGQLAQPQSWSKSSQSNTSHALLGPRLHAQGSTPGSFMCAIATTSHLPWPGLDLRSRSGHLGGAGCPVPKHRRFTTALKGECYADLVIYTASAKRVFYVSYNPIYPFCVAE